MHYAPSGFDPGGFIVGSDSGVGENALVQYFGASAISATDVVVRLPTPVWATVTRVDTLTDGLRSTGRFTSVAGALQAEGSFPLPPQFLARAHAVLGPPGDLPIVKPRDDRIPTFAYDAYRATAQFISPDGRTLLFRVDLAAGSPGTTAALQAIPAIRTTVAAVARSVGATAWGVAGQAAAAADVSAVSGSDIVKIAPVVLAVLFLLLALVLRSLVAPLYLVASVALSYLASLGLAVLIFVVLGHQLGVNFTLPFFLFIFIMALGEDYNILVMSRIREEAGRLPIRPAVASAIGTTGTTVTSAGLVLAGTFGVLAVATSGQIRQIGTGLALGILLDTFVVRTLLVPSAAVLCGRLELVAVAPVPRDAHRRPHGPARRPAPAGRDGARRVAGVGARCPRPRKARARGTGPRRDRWCPTTGVGCGRGPRHPSARRTSPRRTRRRPPVGDRCAGGRGPRSSAATVQAVSASISTPVRAKASTVATTTTAPPSMRAVTATVPRGSG